MSAGQIVSVVVVAVLLFWAIGAHNRLVALRNAIGAAWQQLDALLQHRGNLIAPMLPVLRAQLLNEQRALDALTASLAQVEACAGAVRSRPSAAPAVASLAMAEAMFDAASARVVAIIEQHAEVASRADVAPGIAELRDVGAKIVFARQWYNEAAKAYNTAVRQFPTRFLSALFGLHRAGQL